jgi:hypothetical protein
MSGSLCSDHDQSTFIRSQFYRLWKGISGVVYPFKGEVTSTPVDGIELAAVARSCPRRRRPSVSLAIQVPVSPAPPLSGHVAESAVASCRHRSAVVKVGEVVETVAG